MTIYRLSGLTLTLMLLLAAPLLAQSPIAPSFFDLIDHSYKTSPTVPFYGLRLFDTGTTWAEMNTGPGTYDWTILDEWLNAAKTHNINLLFTLAMTPKWASSAPGDLTCAGKNGPGSCDPPDDLNPDGTGTDQHWKDFVSAIATHVGTRIQYWEVWNEPVNPPYWKGTYVQLTTMAEDARNIILSIDPNAKMLNAGSGTLDSYDLKWWQEYGHAGGFRWADIIAIHGSVDYEPMSCGVYPKAATFLTVMSNLRNVLTQFGQTSKPVWDTEASWGRTDTDCFTDQDLQAAFLAQFYLLHWSAGVRRFYWRAWEDSNGGLWTPTGGVNKAGIAYEWIYNWLVGATMTKACTANGAVWTCSLSRPNGYVAQVVWDTSESCEGGVCTTVPYTVESKFVQYRTISGKTVKITGMSVPIGAKPILLEN